MNNLDKSKLFDKEYFESSTKNASLSYSWESKKYYFEFIVKTVQHLKPRRILDIGCAKGFLVYLFDRNGIDAYGVDVSSYAIENAPSLIKGRLYVIDIEKVKLPFEDDYFDLVFGLEILEHLGSFDNVLREANRVLRKGGYIFFTTPTPNSWDATHDITHINIHTGDFWGKLLKEHGFQEAEKKVKALFKKEFIKNYKHYIDYMPVTRKIGSFLLSLGWLGRILRREMQVYINFFSPLKSTELLIFKK